MRTISCRWLVSFCRFVGCKSEFGQATGVVTLEDAIETMLGREIVDESDTVEDMQALAKEQYRERLRDTKTQE